MNTNKLLFDELENIDHKEKEVLKFIFLEIEKNLDDSTIQDEILEKIDYLLEDNNAIK